MSKKYILSGFLLLVTAASIFLFQIRDTLSESEVLQVTNQHPTVQQWMDKQLSHNNSSYMHVASTNVNEDNEVVESEVNKEYGLWEVTLQSKTGENPMVLNVTFDEKSGDVTSVTENDRVLVLFKDKVDVETIEGVNGQVIGVTDEIPMVSATIPSDEVANLIEAPNVLSVEDDQLLTTHQQNTDWGVGKVRTNAAWNSTFTGKGVKIAVVDSGIDENHEDLSVAGGVSFVSYTTSYHDDNGHGTHVAGIIGAENNNFGTVGVAYDSSIYAVKALDSSGSGYLSEIIAGIDWAITNNMDIINLSLGTSSSSQALKTVVDKAYQNGILVVASSGNSGSSPTVDNVGYPAKYESVVAVGAVDSNLNITDFSSSGKALEVAGPGLGILSTYPGNTYKKISGTSMAAPYVSGNLALLKQANPKATVSELRTILQNNVLDLGDFGRDPLYGYGFIQSSSSYSLHGRNRFETSVVISQRGWPDGASNVLLGRGDVPIDALTGSVLAGTLGSPILLTDSKRIPIEVMDEIKRLNPQNILLLGGEAAISTGIKNELTTLGYNVNRLSGSSRYDTAIKVANEVLSGEEIFLTTGSQSSDPLSIAPYAGMISAPILLSEKTSLPKEVINFLTAKSIKKVTIIGGEAAISKGIELELSNLGVGQIERISGIDRYTTSAEIVKKYKDIFSGPVFVASGTSFVDALPGASLAAKNRSPIILVHKDYVPPPIKELFQTTYTELPQLQFLGGYTVIGIETRAKLDRQF
jgi:minor extracellular protease Epr